MPCPGHTDELQPATMAPFIRHARVTAARGLAIHCQYAPAPRTPRQQQLQVCQRQPPCTFSRAKKTVRRYTWRNCLHFQHDTCKAFACTHQQPVHVYNGCVIPTGAVSSRPTPALPANIAIRLSCLRARKTLSTKPEASCLARCERVLLFGDEHTQVVLKGSRALPRLAKTPVQASPQGPFEQAYLYIVADIPRLLYCRASPCPCPSTPCRSWQRAWTRCTLSSRSRCRLSGQTRCRREICRRF